MELRTLHIRRLGILGGLAVALHLVACKSAPSEADGGAGGSNAGAGLSASGTGLSGNGLNSGNSSDGAGYAPEVPEGVTPPFEPGNFGSEGGSDEPAPSGCVAERPIYASCEDDCQCLSDACSSGFCTQPCASAGICSTGVDNAPGACVQVAGVATDQWCLPICTTQDECDEWYGSVSSCVMQPTMAAGEAAAVCLDWWGFDEDAQTDIPLPLTSGSPCESDSDCNAGQLGTGLVCNAKVCAEGCRTPEECPSAYPLCQASPDIDCGAADKGCLCVAAD